MPTEPKSTGGSTRRRFVGCAAAAVAIGAAPVPEEREEVIPLDTVYAAGGQNGLLKCPRNRYVEGEKPRKRSLFRAADIGPSNLFLVAGKDIDEAMEATFFAFRDGGRVDRPVPRPGPNPPSDRLWAFVYFGAAQSSPVEWAVTRTSVQRDRVRIAVTRPDPAKRWGYTFDLGVYMFWVPLGEPKHKAYALQAYDETNRVTLMSRYVVV
jgi:hypothetical protein